MHGILASFALLGAIVGRTGQAQPSTGGDSVLRAVATALRGTLRAARDSAVWYVDVTDTTATALAQAVGATRHSRAASEAPPGCPWSPNRGDSAAVGYGVAVRRLPAPPDSARVAVSFRCTNPPGYVHRVYWLEYTFRVLRGGGGWVARLETIGVTAMPRTRPNVAFESLGELRWGRLPRRVPLE